MFNIGKEQTGKGNKQIIMRLNIFLIRYFSVIMIIFIVLFLLFGFLYMVKPKYKSVSIGLKQANELKKKEYDEQQKYYLKLYGYWSKYKKINESSKEKMRVMLPAEGEFEELFREIEDMISKRGLVLESLEINAGTGAASASAQRPKTRAKEAAPEQDDLQEDIGKIKIAMNISGVNYDSFKNLLAVIENNLRLMDVDDLDVSLNDKTVSLKITAYYFKNKNADQEN